MPVEGLGVGLANVRARLTEVYGSAHRFVAGPTGRGGFRAEIVLPLSLLVSRESAAEERDRVLDAQFA